VLLRDFRSSDRIDFVALVHDEPMFEYMKFGLDEAGAARRVLDKSGLSFVGVVREVPTWRGVRPRVRYELPCASTTS
jgi:hypothetical protein